MLKYLFGLLALIGIGCSTPTAATPPRVASLENFGRVTIECYAYASGDTPAGTCKFFAAGINKGSGCASDITGTLTIRLMDGTVFTRATFSSPMTLVRPDETFPYSATIEPSTFPEQRTTETQFSWRDVPC